MLKTLFTQLKMLESKDTKQMSLLPNDVVTAIKKRIREGSEDQEQKWANALEVVHKAYELEGVVRPDPAMTDAWKQYEEMLQYAVQQLAKNRGMDGDWRMSSAMFHEALNPKQRFNVKIDDLNYVTEGANIEAVVNTIIENIDDDFTPKIKVNDNVYTISFSKFNIRKNTSVTIQHIT